MNTITKLMYKLIRPNSGESSKRFMAILVSFVIIIISFIDLFTPLTPTDHVYEGLLWLAGICWGAIGIENAAQYMSARKSGNSNLNNQEKPDGYVEPEPPK